jgi:hypothetical protein
MAGGVNLTVNNIPIKTDHFVAGFIDHTVSGMVEALEGTGKWKNLALTVDGEQVVLNLNGVHVPTNMFAGKIIRSTAIGMVTNLKGVSEIKKINIQLNK